MGIVSIISTKDHRGHIEGHDDADDPLPSTIQQGAGEPTASSSHGRHIKASPVVTVILAVALLLGGAATAIGVGALRGSSHSASTKTVPAKAVQAAPGLPASGSPSAGVGKKATLRVPNQGFSLDYPASWTRADSGTTSNTGSEANGASTVLRISDLNAFSIRTFDLQKPVAKPQLADMRAVTDAILSTPGAHLTVLDVQSLQVGGLPAVYYLYYFPSGKQQGIHAHYFVFDGARMYSMVFQVVPAAEFANHAADFDAVVASFRASP